MWIENKTLKEENKVLKEKKENLKERLTRTEEKMENIEVTLRLTIISEVKEKILESIKEDEDKKKRQRKLICTILKYLIRNRKKRERTRR